jgi:leader peptidase (prepilin peptidase)/N-methyltransferase
MSVFLTAAAAYGLVVGSFLNVVIHRVPRKESIVRPGSHCPRCGYVLGIADNLPVISWVLLRGRCRRCREPISARYPAIEVLTAVLFVAVAVRFGGTAPLPAYLVLVAALIAIAAIDLEHLIVPKVIVYPTLLAGILLLGGASAWASDPASFVRAVAGGLGGFAVLFVIHVVQPRGMGFGDVRLAGLLGFFLGWLGLAHVALGLFLGFLLGAVVGGVLVLTGRRSRRQALPFAPFLAAGALVAVLLGGPLLAAYPPLQAGPPVPLRISGHP